jgi:hypothetical protein
MLRSNPIVEHVVTSWMAPQQSNHITPGPDLGTMGWTCRRPGRGEQSHPEEELLSFPRHRMGPTPHGQETRTR